MARTKNRGLQQSFSPSYTVRRWRLGAYIRLSKEDLKKGKDDSNSVINQRDLLNDFYQKHIGEFESVSEYVDDGHTGTDANRENFQRLLSDVMSGKINCVVVKDLSRFGREYIDAGKYIERLFPALGVRFIAVNDHYDSLEGKSQADEIVIPFKNLINDAYCRDISIKIRSQKDSDNKNKLVIDAYAAGIIKEIYRMKLSGMSQTAIANALNKQGVLSPMEYKHSLGIRIQDNFKTHEQAEWSAMSVKRILENEVYTGTLVQGKTSITARDEKNRIHKPEDDWVITKDAHEPLIDRELYQKLVEIREKMKERKASYNHPTKGYPIGENIFDGVLYCGVCGRKMTRSSYVKYYADGEKARLDGYFCLNSGQTKIKVCPESNRISKNELVDILLPLIRMEFAVFLSNPKHYMEYGKERIAEAVKKEEARLRETEAKLRRSQEEESSVYMDYRAGKIPQKEYVAFKMRQADILEDLRKQQESQQQEIRALDKLSGKYMAAIKALLKLKSGKELTKDMIEAFISKIYVYPGKCIEVIFTFTADCMEGVK